ncbi:methyltransferase domain-containing protein [Hoeflea sp.]|uniref:class I SAM-dependent DNA methyltransferase n=1 Tax=Hoeflea sp. TaxID=1940281 RepID=UPI003B51C8D8
MTPHQLSSGDLTADRRAHYACLYAESGDLAAAADLQRQALDLAPHWAAGWYQLGLFCEKAGDATGAADAFTETLRLAPADIFGAELKLSLAGLAETPATPPAEYVEALFDDYAERFDKALIENLDYRVPERLAGLVADVAGTDTRFARVVDLGCGTGLFGERLRRVSSWLEGYDLSQGMLSVAGGKGIYDHLGQADIGAGPEAAGLHTGPAADLVAAADVFAYFGDLSAAISLAGGMLKPGGLLAFTCEAGDDDGEWQLRPSLRYCHSAAYLTSLLEKAGLSVERFARETIRRDKGQPIEGYLVIAKRLLTLEQTIAIPDLCGSRSETDAASPTVIAAQVRLN